MLIWAERKLKYIGPILIDVVVSENHEFRSRAPQFPVETGANITDQVIQEQRKVSLSCVVSDTPLRLPSMPRIKTTYELLRLLWKLREPIVVITGIDIYRSVIIESISIPRDKTTGQALNFDVELVEITYARSNTLYVDPDTVGGDSVTKSQTAGAFNAGSTSPRGIL